VYEFVKVSVTLLCGKALYPTELQIQSNVSQAQGFVPYDTCMPYLACSDDSDEGFCSAVDTSCSKHNVCRTCSTFASKGGTCSEVRSCMFQVNMENAPT
jgi:hypothetical protein